MDTPVEAPPRGFKVSTSDDGGLLIRYRTNDMGCGALFTGVWLTAWSAFCLMFTYSALFDPAGINYGLLLYVVVPFWLIEVFVVVIAAWRIFSVRKFLFGQEELIIERQLLWYRRHRVFRASEITAVRQIKDGGGDSKDSFQSFGLLVVAGSQVKFLSREPIAMSNWFGPVVAQWAGVAFEPAQVRKYEEIQLPPQAWPRDFSLGREGLPMEMPGDAPPRGFKIAAADDGSLRIRYRTRGMAGLKIVLMAWVCICSMGCLLITSAALFDADFGLVPRILRGQPPTGITVFFLWLLGPVWIVEVIIVAYTLRFFFSVTQFLFGPEELVVERQLLWYRRRRVIRRCEITAVRQVKDNGERHDSTYGWGLVVEARPGLKLMTNQPIDKSDWLGPIMAKWAGVSFEPAPPLMTKPKYEEI